MSARWNSRQSLQNDHATLFWLRIPFLLGFVAIVLFLAWAFVRRSRLDHAYDFTIAGWRPFRRRAEAGRERRSLLHRCAARHLSGGGWARRPCCGRTSSGDCGGHHLHATLPPHRAQATSAYRKHSRWPARRSSRPHRAIRSGPEWRAWLHSH